jgi:hypothetical protein
LSRRTQLPGQLAADEGGVGALDPAHNGTVPVSDALGQVVFPALIPGASYRFYDPTSYGNPDGPQIRTDFIARPGETIELGDILIANPQAAG